MRVLLAAVNAPKGEVAGNLERHVASLSAERIRGLRWWSAGELRSSGVATTPRDLAGLLDRIAGGRLPDAGTELGV